MPSPVVGENGNRVQLMFRIEFPAIAPKRADNILISKLDLTMGGCFLRSERECEAYQTLTGILRMAHP